MFDVIVAGSGPAGLNAALVLGRARRSVLVLDPGPGRNAPAQGVHNLLSRDGIPPAQLREAGLGDLQKYPDVEVRRAEAVDVVGKAGAFAVDLDDGTQQKARRLLLANGVVDELPEIEACPRCGVGRCCIARTATGGRCATGHWPCWSRARWRCW